MNTEDSEARFRSMAGTAPMPSCLAARSAKVGGGASGFYGSRVTEAAQQLSGNVAGVVVIEMEGIADAELFQDKAPFREMNARAFRDYPCLAAALWRCDLDFVAVPDGFSPNHPTFVERNGACAYADAAGGIEPAVSRPLFKARRQKYFVR